MGIQFKLGRRTIKIYKTAAILLAGMLIANFIAYFVTRIFTDEFYHFNLTTRLDEGIPFLSIFVVPYVLAFGQWIIGYIMIAQTDINHYRYIFCGEITAKLVVAFIFCYMPTTMERPDIIETDIFAEMVKVIYKLDAPTNLFPSIHCLESWFCLRGCINQDCFGWKYKVSMLIMTLLVFASTVFIKQHVVLDMIGAVVAAELGLLLVKMTMISLEE